MLDVQQSKSILAKLLATENLVVEHRSVDTACFDVHNRVLTLPIFKDVTGDVYDLMVGHEVGHALYTPDVVGSDIGVPMSYLNVVEDARIEKLMKRKFPGLSKSFYRGYNELNDKNFFEIKDKDVNKLSLIDRINLFFKIGNVNSNMFIKFAEKEQVFIDKISDAETFDEVVSIAKELSDYVKEETKDKMQASPQVSDEKTDMPASESFDTDEKQEQEQPESENTTSQESHADDSVEMEEYDEEEEKEEGDHGELESQTDAAWARNQKNLVQHSAKEYVYLTPPKVNWDNRIVSSDDFASDMDSMMYEFVTDTKSTYYAPDEYVKIWKSRFEKYKKESNKAVSYLVKEFEMKKNADQYARSSVAKTGVINTNKLFSYKWNDDIFKKVVVTPGGKSHGLIMYVDWSGSMNNQLIGTIKQLFNLIQFCQRVQIPFEVYYFNDRSAARDFRSIKELDKLTPGQVYVSDDYHLVNMFHSKMNSKQLNQQMLRVWYLANMINNRFNFPQSYIHYDLGSTPLNDTVFAAVHLFNKFKSTHKVDKVNTVFLTDGESNAISFRHDGVSVYPRVKISVWMDDAVLCFRDTKNNYVAMNINEDGEVHLTSHLIDYYKQVTGSNVIGFRLIDRYGAKSFVSRFLYKEFPSWEKVSNDWSKNKSFTSHTLGYSELYFIELNDEFRRDNDEEINIDENASKSKIKKEFGKHMSSKMTHKIILSKFVEQIA